MMAVSSAAFAWCAPGYQEEVCGALHVCYQGTAPVCPVAGTTQAQWQAQIQAQQQAQSQSSTNVNQNSNTNTSNSSSASSATGGNATSSATGGVAFGGTGGSSAVKNAGNNVGSGGGATVTVAGDNVQAQARDPVNTAFAGQQLVVQTDSCRTGFGVGGQGVAFGFSMSGTARDENCELLKLNRELVILGHKDVAIELLRGDERVEAAFKRVDAKERADERGRKVLGFVEHGNGFEAKTLAYSVHDNDFQTRTIAGQ